MSNSRTYLYSVQWLRGLAAIAVMLFHFSEGYLPAASWAQQLFAFGGLGVPVFFMLSGFILPYSLDQKGYRLQDFGHYFKRRLYRLEPAYLLSVATALALAALAAYFFPPSNFVWSWSRLFLHLGYLIPFVEGQTWLNPVYWTLAVEFQFYLFLGLTYPWLKDPLSPKAWPILGLLFLGPWLYGSPVFFPFHAPLFLLGLLYYYWRKAAVPKAILLFLMGSVVLFLGFRRPDMPWILLGAFLLLEAPNRPSALADFLGHASYPLYLFHNIIGASVILHLLAPRFDGSWRLLLVLGTALFCLLFSYAVYYFMERPILKRG